MNDVHLHVLQMGQQSAVTIYLDDMEVAKFEIRASDFERFMTALTRKPVVTVTHGEPDNTVS